MKTIKQFAEDVIQEFQQAHSDNIEFVSWKIQEESYDYVKKKRLISDIIKSPFRDPRKELKKMFSETPTKEIEDYKPILKQVYKKFYMKDEDCDYRQLVFDAAECIYLHRVKQEWDKFNNTQISPSTASNTGTPTNTPKPGENLSDTNSRIKPEVFEKLLSFSQPDFALFCVLEGFSIYTAVIEFKIYYPKKYGRELNKGIEKKFKDTHFDNAFNKDKRLRRGETLEKIKRQIKRYKKFLYAEIISEHKIENAKSELKKLEDREDKRLEKR